MPPTNQTIESKQIKQASIAPSVKAQIIDFVRFIFICLAIVIPIRVFIAQPFIVNGESMAPTFSNGQYLIVDQISYRLSEPHRGDVAIFKYPNDPSRFFIKRVIGLPEEIIQLRGTVITIINEEHPNGFIIDEPYISHAVGFDKEIKLADDEYFVMGDNRPNSLDSRFWGPLPEKYIVGRAWLRLLPFSKINVKPGDHRDQYDNETKS